LWYVYILIKFKAVISQAELSTTFRTLSTTVNALAERINNGRTAFYNVIAQEVSGQKFTKETIDEYVMAYYNHYNNPATKPNEFESFIKTPYFLSVTKYIKSTNLEERERDKKCYN